MKIAMFTNVFTPHVGGVAQSVKRFTEGYREKGHRVMVVAPQWDGEPQNETDVVRVPAFKNVTDGDFSIALPWETDVETGLKSLHPDIIHSHHPYLLGDVAARWAADRGVPLVYTFHTNYEHYTHYIAEDSDTMRQFVVKLATGYCKLADQVIAPSESIEDILRDRGVETPIAAIPTGVDLAEYEHGDGARFREAQGIPDDAFLCGIVSRLAPEKNVAFLTQAVCNYLKRDGDAHFAVIGYGPSVDPMRSIAERNGVAERVHFAGKTLGQDLVDAYRALDAFVFASHSETQGMVLVEALAAGTPLVALDAPGAREVVQDEENGRLIRVESEDDFADGLTWVADRMRKDPDGLVQAALKSAEPFRTERCVERVLDLYEEVIERGRKEHKNGTWTGLFGQLTRDWQLWSNRISSLAEAINKAHAEHHKDS